MTIDDVKDLSIQIDSFKLTSGDESGDFEVACCLWGDVTKPLVVLLGGISADRTALNRSSQQQAGWWSQVFNDDSYLNTQTHSFLTFEYFAFSSRLTNPPLVSTHDQAHVLQCIQKAIHLPQFHAVIGASYGGMVALAFATQYPDKLNNLVCIAAADYSTVKSQALRQIQRNIIELGDRYATDSLSHKQFVSLARCLAMVGYRGEYEWEQRFQNAQPGAALNAVASYLKYNGDSFAERFLASRYFQLSKSIDYHQVDVQGIQVKTLLIGITSDQMVPVEMLEQMQQKFKKPCKIELIDSIYGHDGFLLEAEQLNHNFKSFFSEFTHDYFKPNDCCASRH